MRKLGPFAVAVVTAATLAVPAASTANPAPALTTLQLFQTTQMSGFCSTAGGYASLLTSPLAVGCEGNFTPAQFATEAIICKFLGGRFSLGSGTTATVIKKPDGFTCLFGGSVPAP